MSDKTELWSSTAAKYGLSDTPYEKLVALNFADFIFRRLGLRVEHDQGEKGWLRRLHRQRRNVPGIL
ncbi:hypothetical protein [Achromobacter animicus]|uniref:hypothetical protein n=1 Tax=Achromobacter animicus TaxID=1389935 RepID=UPI0028AED9A2|nr:hypothetical protein [Achromobacter animicus]